MKSGKLTLMFFGLGCVVMAVAAEEPAKPLSQPHGATSAYEQKDGAIRAGAGVPVIGQVTVRSLATTVNFTSPAEIVEKSTNANGSEAVGILVDGADISPTAGMVDGSSLYRIQAGDVLGIYVWREQELQKEIVVRPDGGIALPLVGEVFVAGKTSEQLRAEIVARLSPMIPDLDVTVEVRTAAGNKIYVIGKVNRPGEFVLNRRIDVVQALSLAAGATKYADVSAIKILRRDGEKQLVYQFDYEEIEEGKNLQQNILLQSGDTILVP